MTYYAYKHSTKSHLYCLSDQADPTSLRAAPDFGGSWEPWKSFEDTGQSRIGFDREAARADIERQGYYLLQMKVTFTES